MLRNALWQPNLVGRSPEQSVLHCWDQRSCGVGCGQPNVANAALEHDAYRCSSIVLTFLPVLAKETILIGNSEMMLNKRMVDCYLVLSYFEELVLKLLKYKDILLVVGKPLKQFNPLFDLFTWQYLKFQVQTTSRNFCK